MAPPLRSFCSSATSGCGRSGGGSFLRTQHAKLDGVALFTSYAGAHLGHPTFDPILEVLNENHAVAFVHPTAHPANRELNLSFPAFLIEYTFETTRAAVNLILSGAIDRFPHIRFILSHAGGTLPFLSWRVAEVTASLLSEPRLMQQYPLPFVANHSHAMTPALFMERAQRFWYDTANAAGPQVFASLELVASSDRILFGTDWPYVPERQLASTSGALDISVPDQMCREDILWNNPVALFPRFSEG